MLRVQSRRALYPMSFAALKERRRGTTVVVDLTRRPGDGLCLGVAIRIAGFIHLPLVICRVVPGQTFVPDQTRRHGQQMCEPDLLLFRGPHVIVFGKICKHRGIDVGDPATVDADSNEERCHALGDRLQIVLDRRTKDDVADRCRPAPILARKK